MKTTPMWVISVLGVCGRAVVVIIVVVVIVVVSGGGSADGDGDPSPVSTRLVGVSTRGNIPTRIRVLT